MRKARIGRGGIALCRQGWWATLGVALLVAAAGAAERLSIATGDSPVLGPAGAPVTIVEFVDYQ